MLETPAPPLASPDKNAIRSFFDEISPRYDFINDVLSLRLDHRWRSRAIKLATDGFETRLLDLGTGTGKFLEAFLRKKAWKLAVGLDFSSRMLERAREEVSEKARFVSGDFHALPFQDESFDLIVSSFALRSVKDMQSFCSELYRLLVPGGKVALLCLTRPRKGLFNLLYYPYLNLYLPALGKFLSGHAEAYQFLSQSIQHFQDPTKTVGWLKRVGFESIRIHSFTFGAATLFIAKK